MPNNQLGQGEYTILEELSYFYDFEFLDTSPGGDGSTALTYSVKANCHHSRSVTFNDFDSSITLTEIAV